MPVESQTIEDITEDITDDFRDENLAQWEIGVLAAIFVITVIGNSLVLLAIYLRRYNGRRKKLTRMYFFILHLSVADLITAFLDVLPQLAWDITFRFQGGPILCKLVKLGQPFGPYLSSYVLVVTAIDRYHAICHPLNYCRTTSRRSRFMVYAAWILAFLLCTPQAYVFSFQEVWPGVWDCWATFNIPYGERIYVTWYGVTVFVLPYCVLIYTYTGICIGIWNNRGISGLPKSSKNANLRGDNRANLITKARIKTVKQTIAVITLYATTNSPFIGCELWAVWSETATSSPFISGPAFTILSLLSSLTSCVNPWIYLTFNLELRKILLKQFGRLFCYNYPNSIDRTRSGSSNENSTRSSFISRISRYASFVMHGPATKERISR